MTTTTNFIEVMSGMEESLLKATTGLLIYEGDRGNRTAFATVHPIELDEHGHPFFLAGRPVTRETLMSLTEKLMPEVGYDYLPPEILAIGADWMVWWAEAGFRTLFFDTAEGDPIGRHTLKAHVPALVFAAKGGELYLFALGKSERPMPGNRLYMAPFYNVWGNGKLCQGNTRRPERNGPEAIGQWESVFFDSTFTHPNQGQEKLSRHPGGIAGLWRDIVERKWKRFPTKYLTPANITLSDLVEMLKKGRNA